VAPLLAHGPGPEDAVPLIATGMSVDRLAEWARYDLGECVRWAVHPDIDADLAMTLVKKRLGPEDVTHWSDRGVSPVNLPGWLDLVSAGLVAEKDIPLWEASRVSPTLFRKVNKPSERSALSPGRCREWTDVGIPVEHIRVYEHAKVSPSDVVPYGNLLAEHDPWEIIRAMGLLADSEAQVPLKVIAKYLERGDPPYMAVFLKGHKYPLSGLGRRKRADGPYASFERKEPPAISWRDAAAVLRTGRSSTSLFTLPSLLEAPNVGLMGTQRNDDRVKKLLAGPPAGHDEEGRPWHVGVLYAAPRDPVYDLDDLIGVVTRAGHIGCLMPGYFYLKSFIQALAESGVHFVVPILADGDPGYVDVDVLFLRYRELRPLIEHYKPPGIEWEWPEWRA
jgi:hypothetical protein